MIPRLRLLFLLVLPFMFTQCDPCMGSKGYCADVFAFKIVDKTTQQDLVYGNPPVYNRDSVLLITRMPGYFGTVAHADSLEFKTFQTTPFDTLFLQLSYTDTDTVLINYDYTKTSCCNHFGKVVSMKYNGKAVKRSGQTYVFEK